MSLVVRHRYSDDQLNTFLTKVFKIFVDNKENIDWSLSE